MDIPIRRQKRIMLLIVAIILLLLCAIKINASSLASDQPFTVEVASQQLSQKIGFILDGAGAPNSYLKFSILRKGLGTLERAYSWDWQAPGYEVNNISIIDLDKSISQSSVFSRWHIALSQECNLRLKIWRLTAGTWNVVAQTQLVAGHKGLNEFPLPSDFKAETGDFLGLYMDKGSLQLSNKSHPYFGGSLQAQLPGNLQEAAKSHRQITFSGDVAVGQAAGALEAFKPAEYAWEVEISESQSLLHETSVALKDGTSYYEIEIPADRPLPTHDRLEIKIQVPAGWDGKILKHYFNDDDFFPSFLNTGNHKSDQPFASNISFFDKHNSLWITIQWSILLTGVISLFFIPSLSLRSLTFIAIQCLVLASHHRLAELHGFSRIILAFFSFTLASGILIVWASEFALKNRFPRYSTLALSFCLSLGTWIPFALFGYERMTSSRGLVTVFQWSVLIASLFLYSLFWSKHSRRPLSAEQKDSADGDSALVMVLLTLCMASGVCLAVTYAAQFQMPIADALAHLSSLRNIAADPVVQNCDHILGSQMPLVRTYACNFWYLQTGLSTQYSQIDAAIVYCFLAGYLAMLWIASSAYLARTILKNPTLALAAAILATTGFFMSEVVIWTKFFYNIPMTWLPFPYHVAKYIVLPTLVTLFLQLVENPKRPYWFMLGIILFPAIFLHPVFAFHVAILCGAMAGIWFLRNLWIKLKSRGPFVVLGLIVVTAVVYGLATKYCQGAGPYDVFGDAYPAINMWKVQRNLLFISPHIYGLNPLPYIRTEGGWRTVLAILFLPVVMRNIDGRWFSLKCCLLLGVALTPFLVACNIFIVPILVSIFHTSIPFYRSYDVIAVFLNGLFYAETAWFSWRLLQTLGSEWTSVRLQATFAASYIVAASSFFVWHADTRTGILGSLNNWGWYPSILGQEDTPLLAKLASLGPGRVVLPESTSQYIPAVTELDPMTTFRFRAGDSTRFQEFSDFNTNILTLNGSLEDLQSGLEQRKVDYVLVPLLSPQLEKFHEHAEIFHPIFHGGTDVLFQVKRK